MGTGFIIAAGLCIAAGGSLDFLKLSLEARRRIYWYLALLAGIFILPAGYPDFEKTLGLLAIVLIATVGWAYVHTSYIRIRGRIYAFESIYADAESEGTSDKNGRHEQITTPPKMWWLIAGVWLAFGVAVCSSFLPGHERFDFQHDRELIMYMIGFGLLLSVGFGYGEAKFGYPIAQGQRLQFIIASISSAGLFAVLYLTAYHLTTHAIARRRDDVD